MMEHPLVSIIIPVFNAEKTLKQCVNSIIDQDYWDIEVILINDGSTDHSKSICDDFSRNDKRVIVIHQNNRGVSAARNVGLDIAKGEWITFVDSDDYVSPLYFEGLEEREEDIIFHEFISLWKGQMVKNVPLKITKSYKSFIETYFNTPYIKGPCCKFIKKGIIRSLRFPEDMRIGEDTFFMYNVLSRCKTFYVLYGSEYFVRCPEEELAQKYSISIPYAASSLEKIHSSFLLLAKSLYLQRSLFFSNIQFFKYISSCRDKRTNLSEWYANRQIKKIYKYVWTDLSISQKIRLLGAYILKR